MGTCTVCGKPDIGDTGKCHKHGGRVTVVAVTYNFVLLPVSGTTVVNADFASRAAEHLYKKAIDNLVGRGPGAVSRAYNVNGAMLNHDTIGAGTGNHASIFYRWSGSTMHVYGIGYHPGDDMKKYELMWYDGTEIRWTRPG